MAVDPAIIAGHEALPAVRGEPDGSVRWDGSCPCLVEIAKQPDGGEQLIVVIGGMELERSEHVRCELAQSAVAGAEVVEVGVASLLDLCGLNGNVFESASSDSL